MTDHADLIAHLRGAHVYMDRLRAADALESIAQECATLREQVAASDKAHVEWVVLHQQEVDDAHRKIAALIAERDAAIREQRKLHENLRQYGWHTASCQDYARDCVCGWTALCAALKDAP